MLTRASSSPSWALRVAGSRQILKIASGLLKHTDGSYDLADDNLGYVFQDSTLLPWRTVLKNVELFDELRKGDKSARRANAKRVIETVGLGGFENHHPKRLSGGMRMRVSLARSLTLNPKVFLFDEPFGALDEITRQNLNEEVGRLFKELDFGGLFITHSIPEAVFMSTKVLVMSSRPGRIIDSFDVPFDYPRTDDLRYDPASPNSAAISPRAWPRDTNEETTSASSPRRSRCLPPSSALGTSTAA